MKTLSDGAVSADCFQICLMDEAHPETPEDYLQGSIACRLRVGAHAAVVHTARNMSTPAPVDWSDGCPRSDVDGFQHIVEAGFRRPSGRLILAGLTDYRATAPRLPVPKGRIALRARFSGLDTITPMASKALTACATR